MLTKTLGIKAISIIEKTSTMPSGYLGHFKSSILFHLSMKRKHIYPSRHCTEYAATPNPSHLRTTSNKTNDIIAPPAGDALSKRQERKGTPGRCPHPIRYGRTRLNKRSQPFSIRGQASTEHGKMAFMNQQLTHVQQFLSRVGAGTRKSS